MKCPECGAKGPFQIEFRSWITVFEDGTVDYEVRVVPDTAAIGADDPCTCLSCDLEMDYEYFCENTNNKPYGESCCENIIQTIARTILAEEDNFEDSYKE